jgi:hypothetical protein
MSQIPAYTLFLAACLTFLSKVHAQPDLERATTLPDKEPEEWHPDESEVTHV